MRLTVDKRISTSVDLESLSVAEPQRASRIDTIWKLKQIWSTHRKGATSPPYDIHGLPNRQSIAEKILPTGCSINSTTSEWTFIHNCRTIPNRFCQSNRSNHRNGIVNEDVIRDHLEKPFHRGPIKDASIIWSKRNPTCGDEVTLSLRISNETIIEAWHQVRGCMLCKASASILCEHLQNVPIRQAQEISDADIIQWIGITISPGRRGCCALPVWTLNELLQNEIETRAS